MKTIFTFLVTLLICLTQAQTSRFIDTYKRESGIFKSLTVPMSFDSDSITRPLKNLKSCQIYRIDYVASTFSHSVSGYQKRLDANRWEKLYSFIGADPEVLCEKNIYYQTAAITEEEATKLFHGFIVYYSAPVESLHLGAQKSFPSLVSTIAGIQVTTQTKSLKIAKPYFIDSVNVGNVTGPKMKKIESELMKNNVILEWNYDSIGINKLYYNARYYLTKVSAGLFLAYKSLTDKSLFQLLRRNKIDKNSLIVTDLTGSMYPYYSQLLVWHALRLEQNEMNNYVFFNDGDLKPTSAKSIGSAGGLYTIKTNQILALYNKMSICMNKGNGGDMPENNFEAILYGLSEFDSISKIILICDNWAVPRDTSLLSKIPYSIDFLLCGTSLGVNESYLNLARQNKGTIHTIEKSLADLAEKKDGDKFTIGPRNYKLKNGKIIEVIVPASPVSH